MSESFQKLVPLMDIAVSFPASPRTRTSLVGTLSYNYGEVLLVAIEIKTQPAPLQVDADGVVRVGGTRVTLDSVIMAFSSGSTAEQIVHQFPTLTLADVYAVIAYYLRRTEEVEQYLEKRHEHATETRKANEAKFDPQGLRDRLVARRDPRPRRV